MRANLVLVRHSLPAVPTHERAWCCGDSLDRPCLEVPRPQSPPPPPRADWTDFFMETLTKKTHLTIWRKTILLTTSTSLFDKINVQVKNFRTYKSTITVFRDYTTTCLSCSQTRATQTDSHQTNSVYPKFHDPDRHTYYLSYLVSRFSEFLVHVWTHTLTTQSPMHGYLCKHIHVFTCM